ncbi:hypothetical protein HK097_003851 [Rhizophlyctis rosea]|uniref:Uncharacterized protein n=1 Tax=Rhizophlyctis rosea TaxID=64517 RepID=A0AAD5S234_9FUNG|nr:hypothetical protein HK097_003851 [Rhizophlyctis rosea]
MGILGAISNAVSAAFSKYTTLNWQPMNGNSRVPGTAIETGRESDGRKLYTARIMYQGSYQIGKYSPDSGHMHFGYGGEEITVKTQIGFDILCGTSMMYHWVKVKMPDGAATPAFCKEDLWGEFLPFNAGNETDGKVLYVARHKHKGGVQPGKAGYHLGMSYGYDGKERYAKHTYELLAFSPHLAKKMQEEAEQGSA